MRKIISYPQFEEAVGSETLRKISDSFHQGFKDGVTHIGNANQYGVMVPTTFMRIIIMNSQLTMYFG